MKKMLAAVLAVLCAGCDFNSTKTEGDTSIDVTTITVDGQGNRVQHGDNTEKAQAK